jgi:hypothetical protein
MHYEKGRLSGLPLEEIAEADFDVAVAAEQPGLAVELAEVFSPENGIFHGDLEIVGGQMPAMEKKGAHC